MKGVNKFVLTCRRWVLQQHQLFDEVAVKNQRNCVKACDIYEQDPICF